MQNKFYLTFLFCVYCEIYCLGHPTKRHLCDLFITYSVAQCSGHMRQINSALTFPSRLQCLSSRDVRADNNAKDDILNKDKMEDK